MSNKENEEAYIKMRQKGFSDVVYGNNYREFKKKVEESLKENPVDLTKPLPYNNPLSQTTFTNKGGKTKRNKRRNRKTKSRRYRLH